MSCASSPPPRFGGEVRPEMEAGFRAGTWRQLDQVMRRAVEADTFQGGVLVVSRGGRVAYQLATGVQDPWEMDSPPMSVEAIFDVASLAKPVVTVTAAAFAVRDGLVDPGEVTDGGWSLDDLLLHRAGMPEYLDWREINGLYMFHDSRRETLLAAIGDVEPTGASVYGNAGYLLAGTIIEEAVGASLGEYIRAQFFAPVGMPDTSFRLSEEQRLRVARAAGDLEPGQAFDPLADFWLRGNDGEPGHSGLFTTAGDLLVWSNVLMGALKDEGDPHHDIARFVMGEVFDLRDGDNRRVRRTRGFLVRVDDDVYGRVLEHTGFTGCALWLDPQREIAIVLLTCGADGHSPRWRRVGEEILRTLRVGARHGG